MKSKSDAPIIVPVMEHCPPDPTACIFWLKNRKPKDWKDKRELDITKPKEKPPEEMTDEELEEELAALDSEKDKRSEAID